MKFDTTLFRDDEHENAADYNFDHPNALDLDLAFEKFLQIVDVESSSAEALLIHDLLFVITII